MPRIQSRHYYEGVMGGNDLIQRCNPIILNEDVFGMPSTRCEESTTRCSSPQQRVENSADARFHQRASLENSPFWRQG